LKFLLFLISDLGISLRFLDLSGIIFLTFIIPFLETRYESSNYCVSGTSVSSCALILEEEALNGVTKSVTSSIGKATHLCKVARAVPEGSFLVFWWNFNYNWIPYTYYIYRKSYKPSRKATCKMCSIYLFVLIRTTRLRPNSIYQIR
jgi:hypothetical protein